MNSQVIDDPRRSELGREIDVFTRHVDAIGAIGHPVIGAIHKVGQDEREKLKTFENERCSVSGEGQAREVDVPHPELREWKKRRREVGNYYLAGDLFPRALIVSLISQYDAYVGRLIRKILIGRPELMGSSERQMTFEELTKFETLEAAREYLLEKEVESVLRNSHSDHFKWMEKKFAVPLTKGLGIWGEFIELTERRNLFVHTDGKVSSQYLAVCKSHQCKLEEGIKAGRRLDVTAEYLARAREVVFLLGSMLGHVLWRKQFPGERADADTNLIRVSYDLIDRGDYKVAASLLDFACDVLKKYSDEENELIFVVNRAQAYKWQGNNQRCAQILGAVDWSAKEDKFKLANAVLLEDWDRAVRAMRAIGANGRVTQKEYATWPMFNDFRRQQVFRAAYRDVFGEEFAAAIEVEKSAAEENAAEASVGP